MNHQKNPPSYFLTDPCRPYGGRIDLPYGDVISQGYRIIQSEALDTAHALATRLSMWGGHDREKRHDGILYRSYEFSTYKAHPSDDVTVFARAKQEIHALLGEPGKVEV